MRVIAPPSRVVMATGIGGQGVQLASQVLAHGAMAEALEVQVFGSYGGMMRGGNTDATVVLSRAVPDVPPVAPRAWAGLVMHHDYLGPLEERLDDDTILFVNGSVVPADTFADRRNVVALPVLDLAQELGATMVASMILLGALCGGTGLVSLAALQGAVADVIPSYRAQHVELNIRALAVGYELSTEVATAWPEEARS